MTLGALARKLKLTKKQKAFAEAYAADPTVNATEAARKAGAGSGASVTAKRWLSNSEVVEYVAALRAQAVEKEPSAVVALSEALAETSTVLREKAKDFKAQTDPERPAWKGVIKAAEVLIKHYDAIDAPKQDVTINWLQIIGHLDAQTLEAIRAATLKALPVVEAG